MMPKLPFSILHYTFPIHQRFHYSAVAVIPVVSSWSSVVPQSSVVSQSSVVRQVQYGLLEGRTMPSLLRDRLVWVRRNT